MYNLFTLHNITPDQFYGVPANQMSRKMLLAFSMYEVKQKNDAINEMKSKNR